MEAARFRGKPGSLSVKTTFLNVVFPKRPLFNGNWVVVSTFFYFHPYLGKIPILTNIFQMG